MILARITHDIQNNTLEAAWVQPKYDVYNNILCYEQVKCRNYSAEQLAEFEADVGQIGVQYTTLAQWR